jgi:hypothetical protein
MQNGAHTNIAALGASGRLLGFVRVMVGEQVFHLPVQAMSFEKDGVGVAGGFFADDGQLGILVDDTAPKSQLDAQIEGAIAEAVRHLSRKLLS